MPLTCEVLERAVGSGVPATFLLVVPLSPPELFSFSFTLLFLPEDGLSILVPRPTADNPRLHAVVHSLSSNFSMDFCVVTKSQALSLMGHVLFITVASSMYL